MTNPRRGVRERGSALVVTMVAVVILVTMVTAGSQYLIYSSKTSEAVFESKDQAYGVARAGLIDALSWFRRQTGQPVAVFAPQRNLAASPPVNETENPAVGIVRVYSVTKSVWARYEIRLTDPLKPEETVSDVTTSRGLPGAGAGTVWQIVAHGYVFRRGYKDPNVAGNPTNQWNEAAEWDNARHTPAGNDINGRNTEVAHVRLATEIRRLTILSPGGAAALCSRKASTITLGPRSRVTGTPYAGLVYSNTPAGVPVVTGTLTGTPAQSAVAGYVDDWQDVFGMPLQDLLAMPDVKVRDISDLPASLPDYSLTFYNGSVTFDATHPLRSTAAVLIVNGDLTVEQNSNSFFNGYLYVRGNFIQKAPSSIRGVVIVRGSVNISGLGDYSEVWSDKPLTDVIKQRMGQYRLSQAIRIGGIEGRN